MRYSTCGGSAIFHTLTNWYTGDFCADLAGVDSSGVYAVVGCGPVGLMAIAAARHRGAERIVAIDGVPERLELARSFGAESVSFEDGSPLDVVREATEGRGADAVLEQIVDHRLDLLEVQAAVIPQRSIRCRYEAN